MKLESFSLKPRRPVWIIGGVIGLAVLATWVYLAFFTPFLTNSSFLKASTQTISGSYYSVNDTPTLFEFTRQVKSGENDFVTICGFRLRWTIGLGEGTSPSQVSIEDQVVRDFDKSQDRFMLISEIIPNDLAINTISQEIAAGAGGDIIGPMDWKAANAFEGQWLDISPYLAPSQYDTSPFESSLIKMYLTDEGTVSLPFGVYPSAIFYNTRLFSGADLNPPPAQYAQKYTLPDGSQVDWNWDTVAAVAKLLTIDKNGKHSGQAGFDKTHIVQYGFSFGGENHPNDWATYQSTGGQILVPGGASGNYQAQFPEGWKAAWQWVYEGMWGAQPYIPNGLAAANTDFNSGNVAMFESPSWALCCLGDLTKSRGEFDFGAMPIGRDGQVAGRVGEQSFRIWKGTKHPNEAFQVLTYLIDTGITKLLVGAPDSPPAYDAIPANRSLRQPWLAAEKAAYPSVQNWDVLLAGTNFADIPSDEAFMPNFNESWAHLQTFGDRLSTTPGLDLASEEAGLVTDLDGIFNK